jgi:transcriptional regulator with XRE-family HTH domain
MLGGSVNLKQLREERALSQRDLAKLSGVSFDTIGRIERGQKMRPSTRRKLANALGIDSYSGNDSRLLEAAERVWEHRSEFDFYDVGDIYSSPLAMALLALKQAIDAERQV